jgi:hypothetical protein
MLVTLTEEAAAAKAAADVRVSDVTAELAAVGQRLTTTERDRAQLQAKLSGTYSLRTHLYTTWHC